MPGNIPDEPPSRRRLSAWLQEKLLERRIVLVTGRLEILTRTKAARAETSGDRIDAVLAVNLDDRRWLRVRPRMVIDDATELGDLLPLAGVEYVLGGESKAETGQRGR